jgi:hypothetical protein
LAETPLIFIVSGEEDLWLRGTNLIREKALENFGSFFFFVGDGLQLEFIAFSTLYDGRAFY